MAKRLFTLPEHPLFPETVRKFLRRRPRPALREFDAAGRFDKGRYKKMVDLGMLGLRYEPEVGRRGPRLSPTWGYPVEENGRCDRRRRGEWGISVHTTWRRPRATSSAATSTCPRFLVPANRGQRRCRGRRDEPSADPTSPAIQTRAVRDRPTSG
jgi:hypothetical protein